MAAFHYDSKNDPAISDCTTEPVIVARAPTTISTTLSKTLVAVGGSVTDTATLNGAASSSATGTVTFSVYTNNTCTTLATTGSSGQITSARDPRQLQLGGKFYF